MRFLKNILVALFKEPLAGASFVLAVVGGLAATGSFIGATIATIVEVGPWWLPYPLIGIGALLVLGDLANDGIPERMAIYIAIVWPSLFLAIPEEAKARDKMTGWIDDMNAWFDGWLTEWIGKPGTNGVMTVVSATCIAMAIVYAHRYAKNNTKIGAGGTAVPAATAAASTGRRRGR